MKWGVIVYTSFLVRLLYDKIRLVDEMFR